VYVGAPSNASEYEVYEVDGIKVYLSPLVDKRDGLRISLSKFSLFKNLVVTHDY